MARTSVNNSKHWRDRAAEMRILSTMMEHIETQDIMVRLADDYDKLAERAEQRAKMDVLRSATED
jgi:uncharacterized membrane protein